MISRLIELSGGKWSGDKDESLAAGQTEDGEPKTDAPNARSGSTAGL